MKTSALILGLGWGSKGMVLAMEYFNIGGMFRPYNADGSMNEDEIQALAAFRMAIDEVNADPSLLPGYTVRGTFRSTYDTQRFTLSYCTLKLLQYNCSFLF